MLLGLCGSLREGSLNATLMREAARVYGAPLTEANLRLPLYDGDLEEREGVPDAVTTLSDQIKAAEAVLVVTPEYNQSFSGVMKNALDWVSRTKGGPWRDKPVALLSATAGRTGGARAQYALRLAMTPFRPNMMAGPEVLIAGASGEFDADGQLTDERAVKMLAELMDNLKAAAAAA